MRSEPFSAIIMQATTADDARATPESCVRIACNTDQPTPCCEGASNAEAETRMTAPEPPECVETSDHCSVPFSFSRLSDSVVEAPGKRS